MRRKIRRHGNVSLVDPSSNIAPHISDDLQTMCFSLQAYREPVQEPLHPTGETLRPSSAISTENWKPKDLVRVQGKLSECSSAWSLNSDARCSYPFLPYTFVILFGDWIAWCGNSYVHRREEGLKKRSWEERRKEVKLEEKQEGRKEKRKREIKKQISDKGIYKINGRPFQKTKNLELNKKKNCIFPLTYSWDKFNSLVKFMYSITL